MSDLRGFDAPAPETENGRGKSKIVAGAIVALMLGAAGAYVYATSSNAPPGIACAAPSTIHAANGMTRVQRGKMAVGLLIRTFLL